MSGLSKGIERAEARLKWDPSPLGAPPSDLDLIAATYRAGAEHGEPAYLVAFDSRFSPDGTIWLNRDSTDGKGLGFDEVLTLELDRLGSDYTRVVLAVAIQQGFGRLDFQTVANPAYQIVTGYTVLAEGDFTSIGAATAATVAEFTRNASGAWEFRTLLAGFDTDPDTFSRTMGRRPS
jgi:tellurium resistance protein TerD